MAFASVLPLSVSAAEVGSDTLAILKELSIMEGDGNGNLELERNVTRAEFTKMAVKASKYRNSVALNLNISPYKDVTFKMWYAPYVKTASENSLVKGYSDGSFKPDSTVLYEEAVTVLLRILGYTDSDFGVSWPYGQMGIAESIGMCDGLGCVVGQTMNRNDIAALFGNFLRTYSKETSVEYINNLDYSVVEDVILVATSNEDTSVGSNKIYTTAGTYKINAWFDHSIVGKKGTVLLKNGDELIFFTPDNQIINEYTVYQALDKNIIVTENGEFSSLDIDKNLTIYNKSSKTSLNAFVNELSAGDTLITYSNAGGVLDYGIAKTGELKGPYTVKISGNISEYGLTSPSILKNGRKIAESDIEKNDILYYSQKLNTVWIYSDKVTGIYESASPNKDSLTSVTVSGVQYTVEGVNAFSKLASAGKYNYGDTVTLLLGKDGGVADVRENSESTSETVYGFLKETGTKNFTDSSGTYSAFYATVVTADGVEATYAAKNNYETIKNKVVSITFSDKYAVLTAVKSNGGVSGLFSEENSRIGSTAYASNIAIIEVSTDDASETAVYSKVYPIRLNGITLKSSQVLYAEKNALGAVTKMFIKDVTGDLNKYGIVTEANAGQNSSSYKVDIGGTEITVSNSKTYSVTKWQPCKIIYSGNSIDTLMPLKKLTSSLKSVTETNCKSDGTEYLIADGATAYVRKTDYTYMMISLKDLIADQENYTVYGYYDSSAANGGRIRILTAIPK